MYKPYACAQTNGNGIPPFGRNDIVEGVLSFGEGDELLGVGIPPCGSE